jgi:hypothetical protein
VRGAGAKGRHAAIVEALDIPAPFDLTLFLARLGEQRRRPIRVCPFRSAPGVPCGMWIGTMDADYLYYEEGTTPYHQDHIALHEAAHMLLDHRGGTQVWEKLVKLLIPDVDPQLVQLILGRNVYSTQEERDAETLASLIHEQSGDQPQPLPPAGPQTGAFVKALQRAWGGGE